MNVICHHLPAMLRSHDLLITSEIHPEMIIMMIRHPFLLWQGRCLINKLVDIDFVLLNLCIIIFNGRIMIDRGPFTHIIYCAVVPKKASLIRATLFIIWIFLGTSFITTSTGTSRERIVDSWELASLRYIPSFLDRVFLLTVFILYEIVSCWGHHVVLFVVPLTLFLLHSHCPLIICLWVHLIENFLR